MKFPFNFWFHSVFKAPGTGSIFQGLLVAVVTVNKEEEEKRRIKRRWAKKLKLFYSMSHLAVADSKKILNSNLENRKEMNPEETG